MPAATLLQKETYLRESRDLLKKSFPLISCDAINFIFDCKSDFNFSDAFRRLSFIQTHPDTIIEDNPGIRVYIKYPRRKAKQELRVTDADLLVEVESIPELNKKASTNQPIEIIDISNAEDSEEEEKEARFECNVCYADYAKSEIEDCGAGGNHSVCKHCVCRFVSEQLHGNDSLKFKCIGHVNCTREYPPALLERVLPEDLNRQVIDRTFHEVAKLPGMWQCPAGCGHVGFSETKFPWVECPTCICKYCTKCNEKFHNNKTCDEARQEKETLKNPLHRAHEAMTKATKRFCPYPTCKQEFIKGDGCNKIKCTSCHGLSCYLCGSIINGYIHFKERGGACDLWTPTDVMERIDRKKRIEAGRKVLKDAGITNENEILRMLAPSTKKNSPMDNVQEQIAPRDYFLVNDQEGQDFALGNRDRQHAEANANQQEGRNAAQVNQNMGQVAYNDNAPPAAPRDNFRMNDLVQHALFFGNNRDAQNLAAPADNLNAGRAAVNPIERGVDANPAAPRLNFRMNDREQHGFNLGNNRDRLAATAAARAASQQADPFVAEVNQNFVWAAANPNIVVHENLEAPRLNFRMNDQVQQGFHFGNFNPPNLPPPPAAAAATTVNQNAGYAAGANQNAGHDDRRLAEQFNNIYITDPIRPNRFSLNGTHCVIGQQQPQVQNHRAPAIPAFAARTYERKPFRIDNDDDDSVVTNAAVVWKPNVRRSHH